MDRRMIGRRVLGLLLALALVLSLVPVTMVTDAQAAQSARILFKNSDNWSGVFGYAWTSSGELLGNWPGKQLTKDSATGLYALQVDNVPSGSLSFIFNNNAGSQTGDLSLSAAQLTSGVTYWVDGMAGSPNPYALPTVSGNKVTFTYEGSASKVLLAGTMNDWSGVSMTKSGSAFTYTYTLEPGKYEYKFVTDGNWINDPRNPLTTGSDNNNYVTVPGIVSTGLTASKGGTTQLPQELTCIGADGSQQLKAVTYTLKGSTSGVTLKGYDLTVASTCTLKSVELTAKTADGSTATLTVQISSTPATTVKIHFVDTLGWKGVVGYAWINTSSGTTPVGGYTWPGKTVQRDANGYYTMEIPYTHASGQSLGFLFHNFNDVQTADLSISAADLSAGKTEVWVKPTTAGEDGKYACSVVTDVSKLAYSPKVEGNTVTFRYVSTSASKVYVAGSFNSWSTSAAKMTKSGSTFTYTTTLADGVHEYKFVVDGNWIMDPENAAPGGYDGNSVLTVGDYSAVDKGKVTVKLHFYRESGSYTGWDAWMWVYDKEGSACSFANDTKGKVATYTVEGGKYSSVSYIVRKTNWSDQEFYDRSIDISNVVSGTVHYYLNSGSESGHLVYGNDVVFGGKATYANYDYDAGKIWVKTSLPVAGAASSAFSLKNADGSTPDVSITGVNISGNGYQLTLSRGVTLAEVYNLRVICGNPLNINTDGIFYSNGFRTDYTYYGDDLGANWTATGTTFKVWAPTAAGVSVMLYKGGNYGGNDWISTTEMKAGAQGVWEVTIPGDLNGTYYNYLVSFPGYSTEATDPYADTTGANGDRGMVINLDSTDPEGWENDTSPNQNMSYTDAIIYEMHIREMTIDASSGVKSQWRGKYLGMTQEGTNYQGRATGISHLKELGITHVQIMPTYDYSAVDEYHLTDWQQYAWGYDPKNYNVPEGSFSTDPFHGEVRVNEFKQMVQSFHSNGINVIMDVVYNHAFSGGDFCYNKIVPNYFSRFWGENNWSNGSGVGNDMATERSMCRNFIVDSILHWVEEYHVDGFRFDLAGLIDTQTINEIVNTVHAKYPNVIFYGEGWTGGGDTAVEQGYDLANKGNAWMTPGFGYFNDSFRNDIAGDNGNSWGFATGDGGKADAIGSYFRASNGWSGSPTQTINYVSCHDNYTLIDKIIISRNGASWDQMVKMNNLSAAIYMLAQGVPYIYSGEELLREKKDGDGNRHHNTYNSSDDITKIRWSDLVNKQYAQMTDDYYAGLIAFRKNHAALRCANGSDAWNFTSYYKINDKCVMFYVDGYPNYECSDGIVIILNANEGSQFVNFYDYGIPHGNWQACIHGTQAGTNALWSTDSGMVTVDGISATVLVKGDLYHEESVYNNQQTSCHHASHNTSGVCDRCGVNVGHKYANGSCTVCGGKDPSNGETVTIYYDNSGSNWSKVNVYTWTGETPVTGTWPGTAMESLGNGLYSFQVPVSAKNIIFNDGTNQTNDLTIPTDGKNLYLSASGSWSTYTGEVPEKPVAEYYLVGYINGADYGCEGDSANTGTYKFVDGKLTATFDLDSYVFLKTGDNSKWYMTKSYCTDTTGTFVIGGNEKMLVPGGVELTFTLTENSDGSLTLAYGTGSAEPETYTVSGKVTSGKNNLADVTVELWTEGASKAAYTAVAADGSYTIENVAPGSYTVKFSKTNYVTREYALTVEADATQDGMICLLGDANLDGTVNILDVAKAYAHVKGTKLTDDYAIACADVKGGGSIAITDVAALYAHFKGTKKLY